MAWLFGTGFLVNGAAELGFDRPDLLRLGLFTAAALVASTCTAMRRAVAGRSPRVARSAEMPGVETAPVLVRQ
jgi:hypothetical protein